MVFAWHARARAICTKSIATVKRKERNASTAAMNTRMTAVATAAASKLIFSFIIYHKNGAVIHSNFIGHS